MGVYPKLTDLAGADKLQLMDGVLTHMNRVVSPADRAVRDALSTAGFRQHDQWFYPTGDPSRSAVRISVYGGQYQIWRRRRLNSPWMMIVADDTENFDTESFDIWRGSWPLTH